MANVIPEGGTNIIKKPTIISGNIPHTSQSYNNNGNPSGNRVLKNRTLYITQGYSSGHPANDIVPDTGGLDFITAHTGGVVVWCQSGYGNMQGSSGNASYGNCVKIQHPNGMYTLYAHMEYIMVGEGEKVLRGQYVGYMGNTGNSYGAHLHFEVRNTSDDRIDPYPYLNADLDGIGASEYYDDSGTGSEDSVSNTPTTVEITEVSVKSVDGNEGERTESALASTKMNEKGYEILIQKDNEIMMPVLIGDVSIDWSRKNSPGTLKFSCYKDSKLNFTEGNPVSFRVKGKNVFYGYVFEKSTSDNTYKIDVVVYDQLRYFKNKDTVAYEDLTYSELTKQMAEKFKLRVGTLEDTEFKIAKRLEDGTIFDILGNASDETVLNSGKLFVLYDDYGSISLKNIENMTVPIMIDSDTAGSYKYTTSIDKDVYSKIVLANDNNQTGERELYVVNNEKLQISWGILQYYESMNSSEDMLKETAKLMSTYYGKKHRSLKVSKCFGDIRVRGGSSIVVRFNLEDMSIQNYMVVENVKHTFSGGIHTMDLDLTGIKGEFLV